MIGLLIILMVLSIPMLAIYLYYRDKELKRQHQMGGNTNGQQREWMNMMYENELLKERLKNVELILSELPTVSEQERKKLRINLDEELSADEIERLRSLDKK